MSVISLPSTTFSPLGDLVSDTLKKGKQAIVFVNTKKSAEKSAEDLARLFTATSLGELSEKCEKALGSPTTQCKRLASCVKRGVAFHHAGLAHKQRELIEESFRDRKLKVICATPTLAMGVDLPAYRAILRDVKRFGQRGMQWIPTLEYMQMAGRAGRPQFDNTGQAIVLVSSDGEKKEVEERYINGEPEDIFSKLAVEPALRMYVLSLIAAGFVKTREQLFEFFSKTFYAHQYEDTAQLQATLDKILGLLEDWEFLRGSAPTTDFVTADEISENSFKATALGKRVAELYVDPLTAHKFREDLQRGSTGNVSAFSFIHMVCMTAEMRPLLRVRTKELQDIQEALLPYETQLLRQEPSLYDPEYNDFLDATKTAFMFHDWIEEKSEQELLDIYGVRPGELHAKRDIADWLLFACAELCRILEFRTLAKELEKTRVRINAGVREELLPLLKFKGIGRVRARRLFSNKVVSSKEVRSTTITSLAQIVGGAVAKSLKEQVGETVKEVPKTRRVGQLGLGKFT